MSYANPTGGLPPQSQLLTGRAIFTTAYAVIPKGVMTDIVTSAFPGWSGMRAWVLARPLSGFAETFSQTIVELQPGGGSDTPETDARAGAVLFVTQGTAVLSLGATDHALEPGSYAYLPPGSGWRIWNRGAGPAVFHWIRKPWVPAPGVTPPESFVTHDARVPPEPMPDTDGRWSTQRFADPGDMAYDFHVNIVTFQPGAVIPFAETHVMEHGLFVLEGKAVYRLNNDWVEVEAGDFIWLRAFCPQACYAGGPGPFRYLLYKDVNRLPRL
ncbi:MAG: bifunctional allantoicase/(S)-ureidoglycine aminohydrolase [Pseudomonadota bacterium]